MLNDYTGSETHFQHAVVGSDFEKVGDPGTAGLVRVRHDDAAQPPHDTSRAAEHVHQNGSREAHRSRLLVVFMVVRLCLLSSILIAAVMPTLRHARYDELAILFRGHAG